MQADYIARTGIQSLKIRHNNVLGYFIETTATHAEKMLSPPLSETFIHRQTTASQMRFTTVELSEMETRILNAGSQALEVEKRLFDNLKGLVVAAAGPISQAAAALAEVDLAAALADLARSEDWVEPQVDDSHAFEVEAGRKLVLKMKKVPLNIDGNRDKLVATHWPIAG